MRGNTPRTAQQRVERNKHTQIARYLHSVPSVQKLPPPVCRISLPIPQPENSSTPALGVRRARAGAQDDAGQASRLGAGGRVLGLTALLGSLTITRQTQVIGLPQQTLSCTMVLMAARAQLPQVMLAGVIRGYIGV